ncbi:MAG: phosphotransferase [Candidatus Woesearchaeota archaeon]|nr:phosphotransferase [Nanoarchaeota archaeon]USN44290.1 MAG: phosphotransferase [Candidatus Woesearchaeota archaeon]
MEKEAQEFLQSQNITLLRLCKAQGFMSQVYEAEKEGEELIVHYTHQNDEQKYQQILPKIIFMTEYFSNKTILPCTPIFLSKSFPNESFLTVQKKIKGKVLGKREFDGNSFHDKYEKEYEKSLAETIATIHKEKSIGFGFLIKGKGPYTSWKEFLEKESERWIKKIEEEGIKVLTLTDKKNIENTRSFWLESSETNWTDPRFVHGDIVNPSNILVDKGEITGVLDWEWALSGDPAWEFAFTDMPLDSYIKYINTEKEKFLKRVKCCRFFWLLWAINVHTKGEFKATLYKLLLKETCI